MAKTYDAFNEGYVTQSLSIDKINETIKDVDMLYGQVRDLYNEQEKIKETMASNKPLNLEIEYAERVYIREYGSYIKEDFGREFQYSDNHPFCRLGKVKITISNIDINWLSLSDNELIRILYMFPKVRKYEENIIKILAAYFNQDLLNSISKKKKVLSPGFERTKLHYSFMTASEIISRTLLNDSITIKNAY